MTPTVAQLGPAAVKEGITEVYNGVKTWSMDLLFTVGRGEHVWAHQVSENQHTPRVMVSIKQDFCGDLYV